MDDGAQVSSQSGAERLCSSLGAALCLAPCLLLAATVGLGWNEKNSMCAHRAIAEGQIVTMQATCGEGEARLTEGSLVTFACPMKKDGLLPLTPPASSDLARAVSFVGTGLRTVAEMYQCVQESHHVTQKTSGDGTETVTQYTTSMEWKEDPIDSSMFDVNDIAGFSLACDGLHNPPWPSSVPTSGTVYAPHVQVGDFTIQEELVAKVPLTEPIVGTPVPGWSIEGGRYITTQFEPHPNSNRNGLGKVRVSFTGNDWRKDLVTVLGESRGGYIHPWLASADWLCSGQTLEDLRMGSLGVVELFDKLSREATMQTWLLRVVGLLVLWWAFAMFAAPLGVAADCIPCIGPWLGDGIENLACCLACLPALTCCLGVVGVVWVAVRPRIGLPLILICLFVWMHFLGVGARRRKVAEAAEHPMATKSVGAGALLEGTTA